jgi:hypothetical protein
MVNGGYGYRRPTTPKAKRDGVVAPIAHDFGLVWEVFALCS